MTEFWIRLRIVYIGMPRRKNEIQIQPERVFPTDILICPLFTLIISLEPVLLFQISLLSTEQCLKQLYTNQLINLNHCLL